MTEETTGLRKRKSVTFDEGYRPIQFVPEAPEPPELRYRRRVAQGKRWAWKHREYLAGAAGVLVAAFLVFYVLPSLVGLLYMSSDEYETLLRRGHLTEDEKLLQLPLSLEDLDSARPVSFSTAAEVDLRVFRRCRPIMREELKSGFLVLGGPTRREDEGGDEHDHTVVAIGDVVRINEALLAHGGAAATAPKFWNTTAWSDLNPCVLSVRSKNGMYSHMLNPVVLERPEDARREVRISYEEGDVFAFWERTCSFYRNVTVSYKQWPGGEKRVSHLTGSVSSLVQDTLELMEREELEVLMAKDE